MSHNDTKWQVRNFENFAPVSKFFVFCEKLCPILCLMFLVELALT